MKLETFKNVHREIYTMTLSKLNTRIFTTMNMKWCEFSCVNISQ